MPSDLVVTLAIATEDAVVLRVFVLSVLLAKDA